MSASTPPPRSGRNAFALLAIFLVSLAILAMFAFRSVGPVSSEISESSSQLLEPVEAAGAVEIASNPSVLLSGDVRTERLCLHGVKLGDLASSIPRSLVRREEGGEVICRSDDIFSIRAGRVSRITIADRQLLQRLGIRDSQQIAVRLGTPHHTEVSTGLRRKTLYSYLLRGVQVQWDDGTSRIEWVMISRAER